jgi:hypothetical protein
VATTKERIKTMSEQLEPVAPSVSFVKHAGDTSGKTADHAAWVKDTEERKARGAAHEAKRRQLSEQASKPIDVVAELDSALTTLEAGAVDFDNSYGKPNQALIDSKIEAERLRRELAEAESRLAELELRGDSVTRLWNAVSLAEAQLQGLLATTETEAIKALARKHYGWNIPLNKVSREMRQEFALHVLVISLRRFALPRHPRKSEDVEALKARLEAVGNKLAELRQHILDQTSRHDTSVSQ